MSLFHQVMYYTSLSENANLSSDVDKLKRENSDLRRKNDDLSHQVTSLRCKILELEKLLNEET